MIKGPTGLGVPDDRGWRRRASVGNGKRCDKSDVGEKVLQQQASAREALLQQSARKRKASGIEGRTWNRSMYPESQGQFRTRGDSRSMY